MRNVIVMFALAAFAGQSWGEQFQSQAFLVAMIGIVSLAFGLVTPPYGLCLMIACALGKITMREALRDVLVDHFGGRQPAEVFEVDFRGIGPRYVGPPGSPKRPRVVKWA